MDPHGIAIARAISGSSIVGRNGGTEFTGFVSSRPFKFPFWSCGGKFRDEDLASGWALALELILVADCGLM